LKSISNSTNKISQSCHSDVSAVKKINIFIAMTTLSCALTASALISIFLDPWWNKMPTAVP